MTLARLCKLTSTGMLLRHNKCMTGVRLPFPAAPPPCTAPPPSNPIYQPKASLLYAVLGVLERSESL